MTGYDLSQRVPRFKYPFNGWSWYDIKEQYVLRK
jgi:hypothetical protein